MKPRHTLSYRWHNTRPAHKPEIDPWYKLKGLVEPLGWRLEGEVLQRLSSPPIRRLEPGHTLSFGEAASAADAENRLFLALFKFLGGSMVRVTSTASLLEFDQTCVHLQERLGLPIDPFFVLERTLYKVESSTEQLLVEVPNDLKPGPLLAQLGPAYKICGTVPVIPEGSVPDLYEGLQVYRSAIPVPATPSHKATYNNSKGVKFRQGYHFRNMLTGEIWVSDLQYPVPTGPGWDDHPDLPTYLKQREEYAPRAIEEARLVGMLIAPILAHVRYMRDNVYESLLNVSLPAAMRHAILDVPPTSYNWRIPVYDETHAPAVERFCCQYGAKFPPEHVSLSVAIHEAYFWGMMWIGAYTWRRLMFESMAECNEVGAYFLQRWKESKNVL